MDGALSAMRGGREGAGVGGRRGVVEGSWLTAPVVAGGVGRLEREDCGVFGCRTGGVCGDQGRQEEEKRGRRGRGRGKAVRAGGGRRGSLG